MIKFCILSPHIVEFIAAADELNGLEQFLKVISWN